DGDASRTVGLGEGERGSLLPQHVTEQEAPELPAPDLGPAEPVREGRGRLDLERDLAVVDVDGRSAEAVEDLELRLHLWLRQLAPRIVDEQHPRHRHLD